MDQLRETRVISAYAEAASGGRYAGFFAEHSKYTDTQLKRSASSLRKTIAEHEAWIADPYLKVDSGTSTFDIENLVKKKWPKDVARNRAYLDIVLGLLRERGI